MRYALIDNSTLTGVQRLLGQVPVKNKLIVDMDILCLESLIEAILFYDTVITIDDYKESLKQSRYQAFPQIMHVGSDVLPLDAIHSSTRNITDSIIPRVEAGRFTDQDFKPFFDQLKMNVTFTWETSGSDYHNYFLTQRMLAGAGGIDIEKYSKLSTAIYHELWDKSRASERDDKDNIAVLVDHKGKTITSEYSVIDKSGDLQNTEIPKKIKAFFDALNWLAFRTVFYTLSANNLGVDLFLHPIRHAFQPNFLLKLNQENPTTFKPLIDAMNNQANSAINAVLGNLDPFVTKHPMPLFVTWFAEKVKDPQNYLEYAYQLRQEPPFAEARARLIDLEEIVDRGAFVTDANSLITGVGKSLDSIVSKYGASTTQGISLSHLITVWNLGTLIKPLPKVPNIDLRVKQLEFMKHLIPQKGFKSVYRSVVSDLAQVGRLGKYHEVISSRMQIDPDASSSYEKEESVRYARAKSRWKVPM